MDWAAFADFVDKTGGVLVGIAGTLVASLAVVLTHRERTSGLRNHLFEQQLSVVMELADNAAEVVRNILRESLRRAGSDNREPMAADALQREAIIRIRQSAQVILPNDVNLALGQFMDAAYHVTGTKPPGAAPVELANIDRASTEALLTAYTDLVGSIRRSVGIDGLTEETRRLIRKSGRTG